MTDNNLNSIHKGILLRNGFWFDLSDHIWEQTKFPPTYADVPIPNALFFFRGKPYIFGNSECDNEGNCEYTGIYYYNSEQNIWLKEGQMLQPRAGHTVVEVSGHLQLFNKFPN